MKKRSTKKKTVLVVVAHADDMEFMAAGTVARFSRELGYDVFEYILTDNSKGSYRLSSEELVRVSANEAQTAGRILGLREVRLANYVDGDLSDVPVTALRGQIMSMIREIRADILMSWDPFAPYEEHPDHRQTALAVLEAAHFSGGPLFYPEHAGSPYQPTELYWFAKVPHNARLFVDISSVIDTKIEALLAHACQMELTVDMLRREARTLDMDIARLESEEENARNQLIEMGIRNFCAETGRQCGFPYAEQFRYERIGMLERVLGLPHSPSDFGPSLDA